MGALVEAAVRVEVGAQGSPGVFDEDRGVEHYKKKPSTNGCSPGGRRGTALWGPSPPSLVDPRAALGSGCRGRTPPRPSPSRSEGGAVPVAAAGDVPSPLSDTASGCGALGES